MKTIGLIGGISWHSTSLYYTLINQLICERLGENHSARILLYSLNYNDFKQLQTNNDWEGIEVMLSKMAVRLENAGADCIVLCCNTAHLIADMLKKEINIPFLHIADETATEIAKHNIKNVGLLGTKFTMEEPFFIRSLSNAGIKTLIPDAEERNLIHTSILHELSKGALSTESKRMFQQVIINLKEKGAEAVVFGCTEIGLAINQADCVLKIFDTTVIHSKAAVDFALN